MCGDFLLNAPFVVLPYKFVDLRRGRIDQAQEDIQRTDAPHRICKDDDAEWEKGKVMKKVEINYRIQMQQCTTC